MKKWGLSNRRSLILSPQSHIFLLRSRSPSPSPFMPAMQAILLRVDTHLGQ